MTYWQIDAEKFETVTDFIFLGSKIIVDSDCSHEIKTLAPWKKSYDKPRQHIKKQRHHFSNNGTYSQSYGFSSNVWMWELDHEDSWAPNNWWFWYVVLEKTLESPLDCKEIKPVHPKVSKPWIFIGRIDAEAEAPIRWPADAKRWLFGKDWCWERLKAGGEGDGQGWNGWMTSPTRWTCIWTNSGR